MNTQYTQADRQAVFNEYLVVRCQTGDAKALQQLLIYWRPRLYGYALGQLRDVDAAEDATQESMISICKGIHRLADPASFPKWAYQVVIRRCTDWQRKEIRWRARHVDGIAATNECGVTAANNSQNDIEALQVAIARLPVEQSNVVRLRYLESFSVQDISQLLKQPVGTVKSRLYYARTRLKQLIEERTHEQD